MDDPLRDAVERVTHIAEDLDRITAFHGGERGKVATKDAAAIRLLLSALTARDLRIGEPEGERDEAREELTACNRHLKDALAARNELLAQVVRLTGTQKEAVAALDTAESLMVASGWWRNEAGYLTDAALWISRASQAVSVPIEKQMEDIVARDHDPTTCAATSVHPVPWLPIESAPRDGDEVLLWCADRFGPALWNERGGRREAGAIGVVIGRRCDDFFIGNGLSLGWTYTHWMPLPDPPRDEQVEGSWSRESKSLPPIEGEETP